VDVDAVKWAELPFKLDERAFVEATKTHLIATTQ
jgi:hypothetical protein